MTHPGDLISALLDGELDEPTSAQVTAHIATCPPCADELHAVGGARDALRSLPPVEPPAGFLEGLLADVPVVTSDRPAATVTSLDDRRRRRALAGATVSVAAVILLVVGVGLDGSAIVRPQVERALGEHASAVAAFGSTRVAFGPPGSTTVTPSTTPRREVSTVPAPYVAAVELAGGYRLVSSHQEAEGVHLLYRSGRHGLSVFERAGTCDFDALPSGGRLIDVGGHTGWRLETPGVDGRVVVVAVDGVVVTLVGDESGDAVTRAARSLPGARPMSVTQRLRRAAASGLGHLAPTG